MPGDRIGIHVELPPLAQREQVPRHVAGERVLPHVLVAHDLVPLLEHETLVHARVPADSGVTKCIFLPPTG